MRKKFFIGVVLVALGAGFFGIRMANQPSDSVLTPLQMRNLEALTDSENGSNVNVEIQCTTTYLHTCGVSCNNCWRVHRRSLGIDGLCVNYRGTCACGSKSFTPL